MKTQAKSMPNRSARSRRQSRRNDYPEAGSAIAAFLIKRRRGVGALTAFVVAFSYVSANAIWYQPHAHGSAFFATRALPEVAGVEVPRPEAEPSLETIIRLESEVSGIAVPVERPDAPQGDPTVREVQRVLSDLDLYDGPVDGLAGPQTGSAVKAYQQMVGLEVTGSIDEPLLQQLGAAPRQATRTASIEPTVASDASPDETSPSADRMVMRIQAGLRAFGNDGIEVDGVVGAQTRAALVEFQSLFGLEETGEPDSAVYAKMREIGLTD
jgi:peptidoglycan hydrolase-like protein with peptidoglycan-binding domain